MNKELLISKINPLNACDPLSVEIISAIAEELDDVEVENEDVFNGMFFSKCSEEVLDMYLKQSGIVPMPNQTKDDLRASLEAKWKSDGKVDLKLIQSVAESWRKGVSVDYEKGKIVITFTDTTGMPSDIEGLEIAIDEVKPAHLPIIYKVIYLYVKDISAMTVKELQEQKINMFAF